MSKVIDINQYKENMDTYLDMQLKIVEANGYLEIEQYKIEVEKFIKEVTELSLFKGVMDDILAEQIRYFLITEMLNRFVKLVFENIKPEFLEEAYFKELREEMFENLIERYARSEQ